LIDWLIHSFIHSFTWLRRRTSIQ